MTTIKPLVAGNWKMNGLTAALAEAQAVHESLSSTPAAADVMICPPATLLSAMAALVAKGPVQVGGQDCHAAPAGAHTGDISAEMLVDTGATAVIVGHSERRADHGETSRIVKAKAEAAHRAGLKAIVCVGETAGERAAGLTLDVVKRQVVGSLPEASHANNTIIAYEPVWAIGTGLTPTVGDVAAVHAGVRALIAETFEDGSDMRILYGGSVKPANAVELMAVDNVNGALVGGASLKADDFLGIIEVYRD